MLYLFNFRISSKYNQYPENRVDLYEYTLDLYPSQQREYPVGDAVKYLDGAADKIESEGNAVRKMKTERPSSDNKTISDADWQRILKDVSQTYQAMSCLNDILPAQKIKALTEGVKQLPEYRYQSLQTDLRKKHTELKSYESDIRYNLARLAALHGYVFSQVYLSKSFAQHLWASFSTNYSNTPEGRRARAVDIKQSKDSISSLMQSYQARALAYSNQVITHNQAVTKVPELVKVFVQKRGGNINEHDGYALNQKLLQYNDYLNHNDGDAIWTWLKSCFSDS